MVVVAERRTDIKAAFIIPTSRLVKAWAALLEMVDRKPERFKREASRVAIHSGRARVFISYKRNSDPDEKIALQFREALKQQHDLFIDQEMLVGTRWAERIEAELRRSDFLITLLSERSINS
jgi:TIR domain